MLLLGIWMLGFAYTCIGARGKRGEDGEYVRPDGYYGDAPIFLIVMIVLWPLTWMLVAAIMIWAGGDPVKAKGWVNSFSAWLDEKAATESQAAA